MLAKGYPAEDLLSVLTYEAVHSSKHGQPNYKATSPRLQADATRGKEA